MEQEPIDSGIELTLEDELNADLSAELSLSDPLFNPSLLQTKVRSALREVKAARRYPEYYTDAQIERDLYRYFANIRKIAMYDYNQTGAEFQNSSSENAISRSWIDRRELFGGIVPLSTV